MGQYYSRLPHRSAAAGFKIDATGCDSGEPRMIGPDVRLSLLRRLTRLARNEDLAEDCLQSAIVRLEEYRRHTPIDNVVGFVAHAARNIVFDEARKSRVRARTAGGGYEQLMNCRDEGPLQDEVLIVRERLSRVRAALDELPERTRTAFMMHRFTRAKYREIAVELGISVSAVEKHIARASLALARCIEQEDDAMES